MTDKVEFPGGWAKLRDPKDVSERNRRPLAKVQRLLAGSGVGSVLIEWQAEHPGEKPDEETTAEILRPHLADDDMDLFERSNDLLMVALIEEWSFERPVTEDAVQDLPARAYDAIRDACQPLLGKLLGTEDEEDVLDPNSP